MRALIFPFLCVVFGAGAGVGAALFLAPAPDDGDTAGETAEKKQDATAKPDSKGKSDKAPSDTKTEFVRLNNQFVVPVLDRGAISALMVLSLSLEAKPGMSETIYTHEPKLRDRFLRELFDHSNMGGFDGVFTDGSRLDLLRTALVQAAQDELGPEITGVLIVDIARQDV